MFNLELEKSVLSCMLLDNQLIDKACSELSNSDFHNIIYSTLFDEILEKRKEQGHADITNLKSIQIESLTDIYSFAPTTTRFKSYIAELKELGLKRKILKEMDILKGTLSNLTLEEVKIKTLELSSNIQTNKYAEEKNDISSIVLESMNYLETKHRNAEKQFPKWGINWLDEKTGGVKPGLTYLAARPSVGKTAFSLQIALNVAKQGLKVGIFSLEMDKVSLCNRLLCNYANINKDNFDKSIQVDEKVWHEIYKSSTQMAKLPIKIYDKAFGIEEVLLLAQEQIATTGLDFIIIDYIQLCESKEKHNSTNDRISYISRQLKKFQQQAGIQIMALSQLNRDSEKKEIPTLSSLRDSGSLEQDANIVLFLHEEQKIVQTSQEPSKEINLIIAKQREGERNVYCAMKFYGITQKFYQT